MLTLQTLLEKNPLIAILRGITPSRVLSVGTLLVDAGFRCIEIPMNSPEPLKSIALLSTQFSDDVLIGAGTVTTREHVKQVSENGGRLIVMPHNNPSLITTAKELGLICIPGFSTASEAYVALEAGADALKFFPAQSLSASFLKAVATILPRGIAIFPTGSITPDLMASFMEAGARGFGLGSELFKPDYEDSFIESRAKEFMPAAKNLML